MFTSLVTEESISAFQIQKTEHETFKMGIVCSINIYIQMIAGQKTLWDIKLYFFQCVLIFFLIWHCLHLLEWQRIKLTLTDILKVYILMGYHAMFQYVHIPCSS